MKTIATKAEYYRLYSRGAFGNMLRTWDGLLDFVASDYTGDVVLRYQGAGGGTQFPRYGQCVRASEVEGVVAQWRKAGARESLIRLNESARDERLILQGEVMLRTEGLSLFYSRERTKMRKALERGEQVYGLRASMMLRHALFPASHDDLTELLEKYPDSVIEFSAYSHAVGSCRGRNTIIWEVRNY